MAAPDPAPAPDELGNADVGTTRRTLSATTSHGAAAAVVGFVVNLLLIPWLLSRVGAVDYGRWVGIAAFLAVLTLTDIGLRTEVTRRVASAHGARDSVLRDRSVQVGTTVAVIFSTPVFGIALLAAPWIASVVSPGEQGGGLNVELLRVVLVWSWTALIAGTYLAALKGLQRSDIEAKSQLVAVPIGAAATIAGVLAGIGIWALAAGYVVSGALPIILQWVSLRKLAPQLELKLTRVTSAEARSFVGLASLAGLSQVTDILDSQWDKLVVAHLVGPSAVTSLHIGTSIALQGKVVALLPLLPLLVAVSELRRTTPQLAAAVQRRLMRVGAFMAATVTGLTFVFAPSFVGLWLGTSADHAGEVARWFALAVAANLLSAPIAFQAIAEGQHRLAALGSLVNAVSNAGFSLLLTLSFGLLGAVYGSIVGNALGSLVFLMIAKRRLSLWLPPPLFPLAASAVVATAFVISGRDAFHTWSAAAVVGLAAGCAIVWLLRRLRDIDPRTEKAAT